MPFPGRSLLGHRRWWIALATSAAAICFASTCSWADDPAKTDKKSEKKIASPKDEEPAKPEEVELLTGDSLRLAVTYYRGSKGKETVPIVLLHMWKQSRADYKDLAVYLQSQGYAVIVPDLRGHGQSVRFKGGRKDDDLKASSMPMRQFGNMVTEDMKAIKDFLWDENNAGHLNLDKLCVVGAEMGASVALEFAGFDAGGYDNEMVSYGPLKLGEFVKALVLISPEWSFKGLSLRQVAPIRRVQSDVAILILVGAQDVRALKSAKRVDDVFERHHPEPSGTDKIDKKTLFFIRLDTSLQGTKLLDPKLNVQEIISDFVYRRLVNSEESHDWIWKERKRPHE
jgi:pimeloyl-ACP methyl ester carboxylesterase